MHYNFITFPSAVFVSTHSSSPPVPGGARDDWGNPGGGTEKLGGGIPGGGIPGGGIIGGRCNKPENNQLR